MGLYVYEVLEKAAKANTKEEKIKILKDNNSLALRSILQGGMDSTVEFALPEGAPPLDLAEAGSWGYTASAIQRASKNFKYFVKNGPGDKMTSIRREKMFLDTLETLHPKEAELVVLMKDKKFIHKTGTAHFKGITRKLVLEAFPNLLRDEM
jgi:hypothetical protein